MADILSIPNRKTVEKTVREVEEKLQKITDAVPGGVYRFLQHEDGQHELEFMSRGVANLVDLDVAGGLITFEQFLGYIIPEDAIAMIESIRVASSGPSPWSHQFRVRTAKGRLKWIKGSSTPEARQPDGSVAFNGLLVDITEQMETEALLTATGNIAKIGGWAMDIATGDVKVTDQVCAIFEWPLDADFRMENTFSFFETGAEKIMREAIALAIETGKPWDLEVEFTSATGKNLWVRSIGNAERVNGKTQRLVGTFQDVTDRKEREQELRNYETIISNSNDIMALIDKDFTYLAVNQTYLRVFGLKREDVVGCIASDLWSSEEYRQLFEATIRPNYERCLAGDTVRYEMWFDSTSDGRRYLDFAYYPRMDQNGEIDGVVICGRDITQRKEADDSLMRATRLNEQILEAAGEGIFGVDMAGQITFVNAASAKMTGWDRDTMVGKSQHEVLRHSNSEGTPYSAGSCPTCRAFKLGNVHRVSDEVFWRKDGSNFPVDYVSTPIREGDRLVGAVVVFQDVTEARELTATLSHQATHDSLTGLVNRRDFERRVERVIETAHEHATQNVLAYLDLDQFKIVNDTCGHIAGDELLRRLPPLISQHLRERDTLARLGGDEFGVLLEHCSLDQGHEVMRRVLETISTFPFVWEAQRFQIGVSIGLVEITDNSSDLTDVLKHADAACYMAKDSGRNRIHVYDDADIELTARQGEMRWVSKIEQALDEDRLKLYAQIIKPIREASFGELKYELLVRIIDTDGTLIPPNQFIPAAERYGLASKIDRWVIGHALHRISQHPTHQSRLSSCAFNLSGHSLSDEGMLDFVEQRLTESGVPPEKICFEITETAAVANMASATEFISKLRARGCLFALDDFGSGLSSFAYLKSLDVDIIKIDGMFVKELGNDVISETIVKSINEIAHALGKTTVAEFVENEVIYEKLREIGVDYAQGYGVGRPQPFDTVCK